MEGNGDQDEDILRDTRRGIRMVMETILKRSVKVSTSMRMGIRMRMLMDDAEKGRG